MSFTEIMYILAIPSTIVVGILLVAVGSSVAASERIRRRSVTVDDWQLPAEYGAGLADVVHTHAARHAEPDDSPSDEHTGELFIMEPHVDEVQSWPQVGRHGVASLFRNTCVHAMWAPINPDVRIALLHTPTAEYLFARKPRHQLDTSRTQYVRSYAFAG